MHNRLLILIAIAILVFVVVGILSQFYARFLPARVFLTF